MPKSINKICIMNHTIFAKNRIYYETTKKSWMIIPERRSRQSGEVRATSPA